MPHRARDTRAVFYSLVLSAFPPARLERGALSLQQRRSPQTMPQRAALAPSRPVHHDQPRHARKFARVERHQRRAAAPGLGRDQVIVGSDRRALAFQMRANVGGMRRVFGVERENVDAKAEKPLQQPLAMLAPIALYDPVAHFKQSGDRQRGFGGRPHLFSEPVSKRRPAPTQNGNDDIGIEANHSSKKTRGSGSSGGSS